MAKTKEKTAAAVFAELEMAENVVVHVNGKDWPIVMSPRVLMLAEKATGLNLAGDLLNILLKPTMEFYCGVLYACMRQAGCEESFEKVSSYVTFQNIPVLARGINAAFSKLATEMMKENPTTAEGEKKTTASSLG